MPPFFGCYVNRSSCLCCSSNKGKAEKGLDRMLGFVIHSLQAAKDNPNALLRLSSSFEGARERDSVETLRTLEYRPDRFCLVSGRRNEKRERERERWKER